MLHFLISILADDIGSLSRLIVQTQFLSKIQFTPKNCVWTSVAADSHSSLLPLAKRLVEIIGLQNHKEGNREAFNLALVCNCMISGKVRIPTLHDVEEIHAGLTAWANKVEET